MLARRNARRTPIYHGIRVRACCMNRRFGLTYARLRGIKEASGDLLVFVDDDNVLDPDYLETVQRVAEEKPFLGVL